MGLTPGQEIIRSLLVPHVIDELLAQVQHLGDRQPLARVERISSFLYPSLKPFLHLIGHASVLGLINGVMHLQRIYLPIVEHAQAVPVLPPSIGVPVGANTSP